MVKPLTEKLNTVLANSYVLYLKTQNYHWNVKGSNFMSLHLMFQEQYTDLFNAIDEIAERIVTLGEHACGSFKSYLELAKIAEVDDSKSVSSTDMIKDLHKAQIILVETLKEAIAESEKIKDDATTDLCIQRISIHEKNAWMLKSSL